MQCPGQDSQYWKDDAIYEVDCPKCGKSVEFYKDDTTRKCNHCQHRFVNPKMDFGCAAYCQFAEQCIGDLPEEFVAGQESLLKDKVAVEAKRFFKTDFRRIAQVVRVARYVEQLSKDEDGNTAVLLCSAYIHEMADSVQDVTKQDYQASIELANEVLTRLKASEPMIDAVCAMLEQAGKDTIPSANTEQAILHDSRTLARLEESLKGDSNEKELACVETPDVLLTKSGKELMKDLLKKMGVPQ
ncbi:phosphohydrolase [Desulfopila sp. IMCC35008]|uniref:phosphohydrolase n=1 Tax=Desulfopila sp. IMCC35008 TaxID=2653858 RepID=UPI0013D4B47F|nr:phosphohydrolase [Desulfopila sp. IMCC35008]